MQDGSFHFYPSHLTKGLAAGVVSLGFAVYAAKEFSQVGTDVYPDPPATPPRPAPQIDESRENHGV
jgi:hypothetical protein